jgi:asparagine N-glycosylation enzyme membrane subunit Stt3
MPEEKDLEHVEKEIEVAEEKVKKEIESENARLKRELEELKREQEKLKKLKHEEIQLNQINPAKKEKITEVEIEVNFDAFSKVYHILYDIFIKKRILFYILLILAILIGVLIRSASLPALGATPLIGNNYLGQGGSLTGLDPYIFYINTNAIIATGTVPVVQHLEYLPIGYVSRQDRLLISFFDAFMYRFMQPILPGATSMTWAMLYPVIVAVLATIILFFIGLEVFDSYSIASLSAFIFPVFQTLLNRTTAGFSTKDAMGFLFILLTVYFLAKSLNSKETKSKILYGFLVALGTGLTAATSGFDKFLYFIVPLVYIVLILLDYAKKSDLYAFLPFGGFFLIFFSFVTPAYSSLSSFFIDSVYYYPLYFCYVLVLFKLFIYDKYRQKLKIPLINPGMTVAIYSAIIITAIIALVGKLSHIIAYVVREIEYPLGLGAVDVVSLTVAEFGQVNLANRICDAGGLIGTCGDPAAVSINLLLLLTGGVFLLYYVLKRFKHWYLPFLAALPFILLIVSGVYTPGSGASSVLMIFVLGAFIPLLYVGLHRKQPEMKKALSPIIVMTLISIILSVSFFLSIQTSNYYKYGMFGVAIIFLLAFAFDKINEAENKGKLYIIMLVFFLLAMVFSNLENQLLEGMDFMGTIVAPFGAVILVALFVRYINIWLRSSKTTAWTISALIIILALAFIVYDLNISLQMSYQASSQSGSGLALWGPTMLWINQNTPQNSSLISWWDYGYWEEALANRTTVADGSNAYGYQSMIAKYFFMSTSPYQYATYLNFIHKPTYAVISGSEIEKFSAISTIGLNYTQFTPMAESQSVSNQNNIGGNYKYLAVFGGTNAGVGPLEANMVVNGVPWNASTTLLIAVLVPFNYTNSSFAQGEPYGIVYNELTQQESNPLPIKNLCVYNAGCTAVSNNASAIPGGVILLNSTNTVDLHIGGYQIPGGYASAPVNTNSYGNGPGLLYLPEKSLNTLFTKLYLLNETIPGFTLVFSDGLPADSLLSIDNQVLTNINVYKINYTAFEKYNLLTQQCSISTSSVNYCANLSYLPSVFTNDSQLIENTSIP